MDINAVKQETARILTIAESKVSTDNLRTAFSLMDLTTLNTTDTVSGVTKMVEKVNQFQSNYPSMPNVAAICVYPSLVGTVKANLQAKGVKIASVTGGFPSSQTFISVKLAETSLCVEKGADEVDMVISVGSFFDGKLDEVAAEIALIKAAAGKAHVKVILETGALRSADEIYKASVLSLEAGADFIKTSTGKMDPAATPEAAYIMAKAIRDYAEKSGRKAGFKPAGGIATPLQALHYISIVEEMLGKEWICPELLRLGASKLANNILETISGIEGKSEFKPYF
jgi:deoxyribose-phosphate aldolase